jgi:hypothetical protein
MACQVQTVSALATGTRTNSTVTAPASIADGDILVYGLAIGAAAGGTTATPPTNFTAPTGVPISYTWTSVDTYAVRLYFWTKKASGESGNYTATHSAADTTAFMWRISGADQTTWVDQNPTTFASNGGLAGSTIPVPTQTPTVDGCALLWLGGTWDGFGAATPSTDFTERRNVVTESFYAQDSIQATAGATGTVTVTSTQATERPRAGMMLAIRAAVGGGGAVQQPIGAYARANVFMGGARA